MAKLNFPDPNGTTTYTDAGITWTWNATLGVWSAEGGTGFDETVADARYLRIDAAAPDQTRVNGEATFAELTTHEDGIQLTNIKGAPYLGTDADGNIVAASGSFVLPEDAAEPTNYDDEGTYIGPEQNPIANLQALVATLQQEKADLQARVDALEANEIIDDSVDSSLLSLVASLSSRVTALESA